MSITLQAIVLAAAVVALSVVAVDSLDIWEWEKFAQNDGTVSEYTADKSVYASDADAEKSATNISYGNCNSIRGSRHFHGETWREHTG